MSPLEWLYASGASVTVVLSLLVGGRPRTVHDVTALLMLAVLWPLVLVMAIGAAFSDEAPW